MNRILLLCALTLGACGNKAGPEAGGEAQIPAATELYDAYVAAITVDEALLATVESTRMVMRLEMPSQGLSGTMEIWWQSPDRVRTDMNMPGIGDIAQGYDGETGWSMDPMMGPRVLDGDELAQLQFQAELMGDLDYAERYSELETLGLEEFEGVQAWKVRAVPASFDTEIFMFFDPETGLQVGQEQRVASAMGKLKTTTLLQDYQEFGGMLVPARSVGRTLGMEQIILVEEVELNPAELPDFGPPEAVQALLEE